MRILDEKNYTSEFLEELKLGQSVQDWLSSSRVNSYFHKINYSFKNKALFLQSLVHKSFAHEEDIQKLFLIKDNNERLEFIGDAVIDLVVGEELYKRYPEIAEGDLSKLRSALVNEKILANLARTLELGTMIFMGKGELKNNGHQRDSILCDVLEASIGAVYLDSDLESAKNVLNNMITIYEQKNGSFYTRDHLVLFDAKSKLQELCHKRFKTTPEYRSSQLENTQEFLVELYIDGKKFAQKTGVSKKKLEKELACEVLQAGL